MDNIEVPPFFICPISLEMMKDPVTISTGITYDRESIEKWIFLKKNNTCPVTKQVLSDPDLTPNHNLRRLIQSWCTLNASNGVERLPTPKPPVNKSQILKLLNDAKSPHTQAKSLRRLKSIASTNETNKRCIESAGAAELLVSLINFNTKKTNTTSYTSLEVSGSKLESESESDEICLVESLCLLYFLQLSEPKLKSLTTHKNGEFIDSLFHIMTGQNYESRAYSVLLLKSMLEVAEPIQLISLKPEFFVALVQVLRDQMSSKATRASMELIINVAPWGRNRVKAVDAGLVPALINLLLDSTEKRVCEAIMILLDLLCQCAEGRAELLKHGAGLAVVSKKVLRVSKVASERGVRVLLSIAKFSATPSVVQEMLQLGVVAKLCLVLQVESGTKTKEKAKEILKLHARAWKNSSCIPVALITSYP